jgi:hypothetical protein
VTLLDRLELTAVLAAAPVNHPERAALLEHEPCLVDLVLEQHEQLLKQVARGVGRRAVERRAEGSVPCRARQGVRGCEAVEVCRVEHREQGEPVQRERVRVIRPAQVEPAAAVERAHQPSLPT